MKAGDFMSAKYLYVLAFWIGMLIPTREFLQVVGSRYLDSHVPSVPRVRAGLGGFFPVMLAGEGSFPSSVSLSVSKTSCTLQY